MEVWPEKKSFVNIKLKLNNKTILHCHICHHNLCASVRSVADILFYFISAGGGLCMAVEERNPRVESKASGGRGCTGEPATARTCYVSLRTCQDGFMCFSLSLYRVNVAEALQMCLCMVWCGEYVCSF